MSGDAHVRFRERLGVRFPRATRRNIYVRSYRAGERVMASITRFLADKLRLKVNETKSAVARPEERNFLGFANDALAKFKDRVRDITAGHEVSVWKGSSKTFRLMARKTRAQAR
jgi:RNA-directed DNA polymerase